MGDLFKNVVGALLIVIGIIEIVGLSAGNMWSLMYIFGIITGVLSIISTQIK